MSFLKRSFSKRKPEPINLQRPDAHGSDAFFDALLKSCATPTTPGRTGFSGYESTPEPIGHPEPPSLHRHVTTKAIPTVPESKYYRTSDGLERELSKPVQAAGPAQWPTRTSSIKGSQRYADSYQHLIQNHQKKKHKPSSLTSVESYEDLSIEDGYDHQSEQRHEVLRNHGFWPRLRRDDDEPLHRLRRNAADIEEKRRSRQDYDRRPPSLRREHAFVVSPPPIAKPENSFDLRRRVPFEPVPAARPVDQSIPDFLSIAPSIIGLVPRPLFSKDQPTSRWSHSDSDVDSVSVSESEYSLSFEDSAIFRPRGGAGNATPLTPLSPWPHTSHTNRPAFKDEKLEKYRLADPGLSQNIRKPMLEIPYLHVSWSLLSHHEYLMALGYHALTEGLDLPLIYAARPNVGKEWTGEGGVAYEVEKFNGRVKEMCKVELQTIEGVI